MRQPNSKFQTYILAGFFLFIISCSSRNSEHKEKTDKVQPSEFLSEKELSAFVKQTKTQVINTTDFKPPFNGLQFNKVIAYDFNGDEQKFPSVFDKKTEMFSPVVLRQKELNLKQIKNLVADLTDNKTYGEGTSACFLPHLGIVFYQDNRIVFEVDVCLDCNYLESTAEIPATMHKKMKLEDGSEIELKGFSTAGKNKIISLCKDLGLDYGTYKSY